MAGSLFGQAQPQPAFEAVSVKPSPPTGDSYSVGCRGGPGSSDPGLLHCWNYSLANLIVRAFQVTYDQISGPDFLRTAFFEIDAKVPAGTTQNDFRAMLRKLMADRFALAVHYETREMQVFDLVVAKGGPKLKKADPSANANAAHPLPEGYPKISGPGMAMSNGRGGKFESKYTLDALARWLRPQLHRPVNNATGLDGEFEILLYWATDELRETATTDPGPSLEKAVEDQLGLRLVAKRGSSDFLVVDRCEKTPAAN